MKKCLSPDLRSWRPAWFAKVEKKQRVVVVINQGKFLRVRRGCQASRRKGLTSGEVPELPGKFGELPGKFGKLPGNLWIAVKCHSERTSGEVAENFRGSSGNFQGSPGNFREARGRLTPYQRLAKFVCKLSWEPRNIYHHHPETKIRKSSEANSGSIHPYGRYGNAVQSYYYKLANHIYHSDSLACQGHLREDGRYGGGGHVPVFGAGEHPPKPPFWKPHLL